MEWSCLDVGQFLEIGSPLGCNQGAHFLHFVFLSRTITTVVKFRRDSAGSLIVTKWPWRIVYLDSAVCRSVTVVHLILRVYLFRQQNGIHLDSRWICIDILENGLRPLSDSLVERWRNHLVVTNYLCDWGPAMCAIFSKGPINMSSAVKLGLAELGDALRSVLFSLLFFVRFQNTDYTLTFTARASCTNFGILRYPITQLRPFTCNNY